MLEVELMKYQHGSTAVKVVLVNLVEPSHSCQQNTVLKLLHIVPGLLHHCGICGTLILFFGGDFVSRKYALRELFELQRRL